MLVTKGFGGHHGLYLILLLPQIKLAIFTSIV